MRLFQSKLCTRLCFIRRMSTSMSLQIRKVLEQLVGGDVNNFEITVHDPNKKGEGFLSEILFISLKDKRSYQELNVIVKQAFKDDSMRDFLPVRNVFMNEISFYTKVWPRFDKFQERILSRYRFRKVPRYLASALDRNSEYLVLENLRFQQFETHNKKVPLDGEHFVFILKEYGKFHGLSFAYKALHPAEYADLAKELVDIYLDATEREFFQNGSKYVYEICAENLQPGVDDAVIERFRPYLQNREELFLEQVQNKTEYTVITHGDCWSNNMMFKYDDSRKVTDVRFLDFQISRDASPCCDLSYCIYSGASREVLNNLDYYLRVYHDSLSETLKQFGCDAEKLYPLQALKEDWKRFFMIGFTMSLIVWKIKLSHDNELKDFTDMGSEEREKVFQSAYDVEEFRKVSRDLLYHLYENDFL